jgi:O-antigen ligase
LSGVYFLVGAVLVLGQCVPSITHEVATGESLPQILLWLLAIALLSTDRLVTSYASRPGLASSAEADDADPTGWPRSPVGWLTLAFVASLVCATWSVREHGNYRFAINSAWQWLTLPVAVLLLYRIMVVWRMARLLFALMLALAWFSAFSGIYQVTVSLPADRAAFRENPVATLRQHGIEAAPGTALYQQFESRLQDGTPTGPFALTNSLAGFLLPWMVILVGLGLRRDLWRSAPWRVLLGIAVFGCMGWCLIWTKSRTAWLGLLFGISWVIIGNAFIQQRFAWRQWRELGWRLLLPRCLLGLLTLGFLLLLIQLWDPRILSEATRSLAFRGEYWRATLGMILEHPWLGVGPGNFQAYYAAYKPLLASETVVDPHNFLLETTAVAGLPCGLAVVGMIAWLGWRTVQFWRTAASLPGRTAEPSQAEPPRRFLARKTAKTTAAFYLGALVGGLALWLSQGALGVAPEVQPLLLAFPFIVGFLMADFLMTLERPPTLIESKPLVIAISGGLLALGCHLLASSGWMTPGIANSIAVLVAGLLSTFRRSTTDRDADEERPRELAMPLVDNDFRSRFWRWGGAIIAWGMLGLFYGTAWWPRQQTLLVENAIAREGLDEARAKAMIAADRWNPTAHRWYCEAMFAGIPSPAAGNADVRQGELSRFRQAMEGFLDSDRAHHLAWAQAGTWELGLSYNEPNSLHLAMHAYEEAARRAPGDIGLLTQVALIAWLLEDQAKLRDYLQRVDWIDTNTVHQDRRLGAAIIYWPTSVGPSSTRMLPEAWRDVRQTQDLPAGWVRAEPVARFLHLQVDSR